jgi:urease beta subunit
MSDKINKIRGSQIGCHFHFDQVAVLVTVAQK